MKPLSIVLAKWKYANVRGVHKSGDKSYPANYRPISLTCLASKIRKHIVHSHVMKHLEYYAIVTDAQHGFRAKRFTVTQLILTIHYLASLIKMISQSILLCYIWATLLTRFPIIRLLRKLRHYGICCPLLDWFASFLTNRTQSVTCDGKFSNLI